MAELALVMSMITVTSTATSILGIIKRRCGASRTTKELAIKCTDLVEKIRELLKTLQKGPQMPHDVCAISTALNHRREEFDTILKNLEKMNRLTKRSHPIDRTEKFILAQGWGKKMETIYLELVHLRDGIEGVTSSWDVAKLIMKHDEIVTIDVTKKEESRRRVRRLEDRANRELTRSGPVSLDQILMTMVKLSDAEKAAVNQCGNLDELSLPDALFAASISDDLNDAECCIQLMMRSAELLHPEACWWMGISYRNGYGVEKNHDLALFHFRVASSRGDIESMIELMEHYANENNARGVLKYVKMACTMYMSWAQWVRWVQFAISYSFESTELVQPLTNASEFVSAIQECVYFYFGESVLVPPGLYHVIIELSDHWYNKSDYNPSYFPISNSLREYLYFLSKSNQFLPFFALAYSTQIFTPQKLKCYAVQAANSHCVDAHVFLAFYNSWKDHSNKHKAKRHLRIAADAGHSESQLLCRQLFGRTNVPKAVKQVEQKCKNKDQKERDHSHAKKLEKNNADLRKKRRTRGSQN